MDVADDGDGRGDVHDVGLAHEDLLRLLADLAQKRLAEEPLLEQFGDAVVDVEDDHRARRGDGEGGGQVALELEVGELVGSSRRERPTGATKVGRTDASVSFGIRAWLQ
jgi:hypothetical protein